jgi:glycosyltransferase involved in cell wall biosynthesis
MKILYFHQYFSTPDGSSGLRSYEFARALISRGHEVLMVCGRYDGSKTGLEEIPFVKGRRKGLVDGIMVNELFLPYSNKLSFLQRTRIFVEYALLSIKIALTEKCDIIFATTTPLTAALPGIFARWLRNKKFVFEVRDLWPELPAAMGIIKNPVILGLMKLLEITAYRSAYQLIGLSPGIVDGIIRVGIKRDRVTMIPNGCDSGIFKPRVTKCESLKGINKGDFVGIFTGTHGVANGLDAVLDAAAILIKKNRTDIKFLFVGNGKLKPHLKERAKTEKLSNCVFMDPVPKNNIAKITADCDCGMMILANVPAFYFGTSPNKFFDYIACGLPIVNNYPGWIAGMIQEYQCGVVVPPENPDELAEAMIRLSDDRNAASEMGKSSLLLSQKFQRTHLAEQFCLVIESLSKS